MEIASLLPSTTNTGFPSTLGHKPTKKEAKRMQQRLERLAKVNIHLQGKNLTSIVNKQEHVQNDFYR